MHFLSNGMCVHHFSLILTTTVFLMIWYVIYTSSSTQTDLLMNGASVDQHILCEKKHQITSRTHILCECAQSRMRKAKVNKERSSSRCQLSLGGGIVPANTETAWLW